MKQYIITVKTFNRLKIWQRKQTQLQCHIFVKQIKTESSK